MSSTTTVTSTTTSTVTTLTTTSTLTTTTSISTTTTTTIAPPSLVKHYVPYDGTNRGRYVRVEGTTDEVLQYLANKHIRREQIVMAKDDFSVVIYRID